ncbi:hypothetical protein OT109_05730 [Phycisphaeraceae bacterium D3-23]
MHTYVYGFGYENPKQLSGNITRGWDDEDNQAILITACSEEEALAWGRQIAEAFLKLLFQDESVSWQDRNYADRIEQLEKSWPGQQCVNAGVMPDFTKWLAPYGQG